MSEEAALIAVMLAIAVSIGVLAFKLGRSLITRYPQRWIVKLPVYFAGYHICWFVSSFVLIPVMGQGIFILNPIYALALKNARAFEVFFAAVLPRFQSGLSSIIALIAAGILVTTSLWVVAGILIGGLIDFRRKQPAPN